jgi:transcriptional regulator with XRE-family HTH domain
MKLGKNIIDIRKQNNLTQDDLANKYFVAKGKKTNCKKFALYYCFLF